MKLFAAIFMMLLGITLAEVINHSGRPGCQTDTELNVKFYRNFWDSTRYWECKVKGQPGVVVRCPDQTGFLDSLKTCVPWGEWIWETPKNPPSLAV